jgi:hypothetical protein
MKQNEKALFDLMEDEGFEIINISDFGLMLENTPVTHAIAMQDFKTKQPCVMLTNGEPSDKHAIYWGASGNWENDEFEKTCGQIVELF